VVIFLDNRSLIRVSGKDAETFLHSQFTNDVKKIQEGQIQLNAYCQHQGKVIAILWVFRRSDTYYLSIPNELKDLILSKLNMFKLMSEVQIEDFSEIIYQYGLIHEDNEKSLKFNKNLSILTTRKLLSDCKENINWEIACINEGLPEIYLNTSERHIPQALNLDINQIGVSFTKGCYPGQEVVARMHYLGKPKRRLFRFTSKFEALVGDSLDVDNSKSLKSAGQVIRVASKGDEFYFLGIFETDYIDDHIFLNNDQKKLVNVIHE